MGLKLSSVPRQSSTALTKPLVAGFAKLYALSKSFPMAAWAQTLRSGLTKDEGLRCAASLAGSTPRVSDRLIPLLLRQCRPLLHIADLMGRGSSLVRV